ncbi:glycosyltransferase family A protein [Rhodoluna lacicola]|uniref:Glycosyl transferase family 2 n=1 Tax=Rhodoluna lacicola TaxID=529884 RepID=A0A060JKN6_9MICO|nr:glycosyltransferase family A protein [Rhodoluna lacicola]AIC46844.1 Glycosyl transferase family 2 [Rhodoluna lacicola]
MDSENSKKQVDVFILFHAEGLLALPAMKSAHELVQKAKSFGKVTLNAVLDNADPKTKEIVSSAKSCFDSIHFVEFGDLGKTRNFCIQVAKGSHISMLDGDDLWGAEWISRAMTHESNEEEATVLHPEFLYYFHEDDLANRGKVKKSFFIRHQSSILTQASPKLLYLANFWSANNFMPLSIARKYPYRPTIQELGLGIEDWSWNLETVANGILHEVVPGTIHFIRVKQAGSLGVQNSLSGLSVHRPNISG